MLNGLILEGGAMRGMFTAGVLDVFMENDIEFDGTVGVSAGAVFGCNFKSHQIGRAVRYSKRFARDPRYAGIGSWLRTGNLYNRDFCYRTVPQQLDIFDTKAFCANPMEFIVCATDIETGNAVYAYCDKGDQRDLEWLRASASMPLLSRPVMIGNRLLLDGGVADSIPIRFMEDRGYDRNVVILTQPVSYRKEPNILMPLIRAALGKYPRMIDALKNRHIRYNEVLDYIKRRETEGKVFVIRPAEKLRIGRMERDRDKLDAVYRAGRSVAEQQLPALRNFLEKS